MTLPISSISTALIVGGGIAGMASAITLARAGVSVRLIDLDPDWKVYGAGITITGPTLRAYRDLGLIDAIKAQGAITNGTRIRLFNGQVLEELDEPSLEEGLPATGGIMRPVLHRIMQAEVRALDVPVSLGLTVDALTNRDDGVDVTFSDGSSGRYDLVIGADSIYSKVRGLAFPHAVKPPYTGQYCLRVSMQRPPEFEFGEFYFGHKHPGGITACAPDRVYMFLLVGEPEMVIYPEDQLFDMAQELMAPFGGNIGWMRDNMTRQDWINYRPLEAAIQPRGWSNGRIMLAGDAAHATTPHLASGAGMAVEDAIVLGQELAVPDRPVEAALTAWEDRRYDRCRDVVETSIAVGKLQLAGGNPKEIGAMIGGALHRLAAPI